jgi:omega-amidase
MGKGRRPLIGVMGAGEGASPRDLSLAEELGRAIARQGWGLLTGGRPSGVMAAASRGAMAVDGHLVVGVLPDDGAGARREGATAELDVALFTGLGQARNVINVLSSDVVVVCGAGGPGTVSEAAQALKAARPLVLLAAAQPLIELFACLDAGALVCGSVAEAIAAIANRLTGAGEPDAAAPSGAASSGGREGERLPVALVQLQAGEDAASNRRHAEAWLERALQPPDGRPTPRLLMLPEVWNAPYAAECFGAYAEPVPEPGSSLLDGPSPALAMVARLAQRHGVAVIAGSIPERGADGCLYNTATVIDGQGRLLAKHRKLHLFDVDVPGGIRFRESDSLSPGQWLTVLNGKADPLATGLAEPPTLGLLICYDIRFPELALLMRQRHGCALLACPAAFNTTTGPHHWHLLMRTRAVDSQCFLLACSSARPPGGEGYPSYGHSLVVDPWGTVIGEAGTGEQVLHAELDLEQVARARQAIPTGEQRRGDLYRLEPA